MSAHYNVSKLMYDMLFMAAENANPTANPIFSPYIDSFCVAMSYVADPYLNHPIDF